MWELRCLPITPLNPVPKDIEVARSQTPKNILELTQEIGLLPNEVSVYYFGAFIVYVLIIVYL